MCCQPSLKNRCSNLAVDQNIHSIVQRNVDHDEVLGEDDFANKLFLKAFGAPTVRSEGGESDEVRLLYLEMTKLNGRQ